MGRFGKYRKPKFMKDEFIPESHGKGAIQPEIVSLTGHGDDHAMIVIKTGDGQEIELRFDYDGDGMLISQHGDHEYSIPVEVEVVSEKLSRGQKKLDKNKNGKLDKQDFEMLRASKKKEPRAEKTFENFVNECWNPMEEGYNPAMSEEAKRAIKTICENLLIKEAQSCDEDHDPMHTYENYLNECGSYMTECMMEAAAGIEVDEDWNWEEHSSGEKRRLKLGQQVLKRYQMLGAYLRALGEVQGDPGKYLLGVPGISAFTGIKASGQGKLTLAGLADALDINVKETLHIYVSMFVKLLKNEKIENKFGREIDFPKLRESFIEFKRSEPRDLMMSLGEFIADPITSNRHRSEESETLVRSKEQRDERKRSMRSIKVNVNSLILSLMKIPTYREKGIKKVEEIAIRKIATDHGLEEDLVRQAFNS